MSSCWLQFLLAIEAACVGLGRGFFDPLLPFWLLDACWCRVFIFFVILDWYLPGATLSFCAAAAYVAVAFLLLGSLEVDSSAAAAYDGALGFVSSCSL